MRVVGFEGSGWWVGDLGTQNDKELSRRKKSKFNWFSTPTPYLYGRTSLAFASPYG